MEREEFEEKLKKALLTSFIFEVLQFLSLLYLWYTYFQELPPRHRGTEILCPDCLLPYRTTTTNHRSRPTSRCSTCNPPARPHQE